MGKGDARRPTVVTDKEHQKRWDKAFPKKGHALLLGDGYTEIEEKTDEQAQQPRSE